jgi:ATP synthase protein I
MWRIAGTTGAVGLEIGIAVGFGYVGGHYLDQKLGTQPWLTYLGFAAGIGAAVKAVVRVARAYKRDLGDGSDKGQGTNQDTNNDGRG